MFSLRGIKADDLLNELKRRLVCATKPRKSVILIGAPGSGKGTQAEILRDELCIWY